MTTTEQIAATGQGHKHSVLVVDDHPIICEVLIRLLNRQSDFTVVGKANSMCEARQAIKQTQPEVMLLDFGLPDGHGLELIKDIRAQSKTPWILVFTVHDEAIYALRALRAGANGYLMKNASVQRILEALRLIAAGGYVFNQRMLGRARGIASQDASTGCDTETFTRLSDRELEVFEMIGRGAGTREIAAYLNRSAGAIETCRASIKAKLHLDDAAELVCRAIRWGDCNKNSAI